MVKIINNYKKAVIVLHEIYGINSFIEDICSEYHSKGFDIYCPNIIENGPFNYAEEQTAYNNFFMEGPGFDYCKNVEILLRDLNEVYDTVLILGFSVGATIAWRCCENRDCHGIICIYGSRIRDYLQLIPVSPTLMVFAENDSFDVNFIVNLLKQKPNITVHTLPARHGFIDHYSPEYNREPACRAKRYMEDFFKGF